MKIAGVIKDYPSNTGFRIAYLQLSNSFYNNMNRTTFHVKIHKQADVDAVRKKIEEHKSLAKMHIAQLQDGVKNYSFSVLRNWLIVIQVFIGCFFFFISLSLYKQVRFTQTKDKGIVVDNITQIDVGYYTSIDFRALGQELLKSPHIEDVTFTTTPVLAETGDWYSSYNGNFAFTDNLDEQMQMNMFVIEPNFFDFFEIQLQKGNRFSDVNDIIINNAQLQTLPDKNPVGKSVKIPFLDEAKICGITNDYYYSTMQYPIAGLCFQQATEDVLKFTPYQYIYIKTKPENRAKAMEYTTAVVEKEKTKYVAPDKRFIELNSIQEAFNRPEKILFRIFGFLSVICILVVAFGIYSLVTLTIEQRKKEIAIRKINGAEIRDILVLFIKNYLLLVIVGNILSLPVAYFFIDRWLEYHVYQTALSWWLFALVFIVTCLIVLLSIFEKVRTAAKENPAETIKN
ncbi:MAG: FtsX-like permease family protein [Dysgonamonadaceae bacterium]|jgi:ABC-type antimicrobial peptide transport system permease subunit|nr:FtsX-like permease family protein [Dysgonamonadaceae bacterium]